MTETTNDYIPFSEEWVKYMEKQVPKKLLVSMLRDVSMKLKEFEDPNRRTKEASAFEYLKAINDQVQEHGEIKIGKDHYYYPLIAEVYAKK